MRVNALDHVNIITDRLDETAEFYRSLLGLERRDAPAPLTPRNAQWMYDEAGRAIIHINSEDCPRAFDRTVHPGDLTGAIHHVALNCAGYDEMIARIEARGLAYQVNTVAAIGLRQIFTADPNNVLLELNFFGD
ncbi:glyoxalase/bleomycin resistance/extradiol dioxygenase family protein [Novosphingobium sp. NBM11]|uniref:VOC family protein n=1 Tax=Novosphingobium sp. NBM11 TaxID=2596914 RepID=UPI0018923B7E|nr:VOC family protein [Novosphingobium sp. NBM11]MBF5090730.1 glyoxalase/bleomycin resistance/extradiol dioxygenase family protein [Novosphingobium sp. NBM11]